MRTLQDIEPFRALVEQQQKEQLKREYPGIYERDPDYAGAWIKMGRKFACVDIGGKNNRSGKYMVDLETGIIYGIKGYGVVHRGHTYGTLDTINDWDWSGYTATRKVQVAA